MKKGYELMYNRLKQGRMERLIKSAVHDKGEFPEEITDYLNPNKK